MRDSIFIATVFALVRLFCWRLGISFDDDNLGTWWQIADPVLLSDRLWPTLFYLHAQPPLFNLLIGLALRAGPAGFPVVMAWVYGLVSLGGILALHALGRDLLRSRWISLALALWFCVSPDVLLFNEKLFYDGLVPWLLCIGFWGICTGLQHTSAWRLTTGFLMLAIVVLLRSMFHPVWLLIVAGLTVWLSGCRWRAAASALPGLLPLVRCS